MARDWSNDVEARQRSTMRRLKALVALLVLSNLALGLIAFYYLRAIDRKYSDLIGRTVPALNELQELTTVSGHAMRATNPILFANATPAQIVDRGRAELSRDRELRQEILKRQWLSDNQGERIKLKETGDEFDNKTWEIIDMFGAGRTAEASQLREQTLRPLFDRYVSATSDAAGVFHSQSLKTSNVFTARTVSVSKLVLGFATWPVVLLTAIFLVTSVMALALLFFFDRRLA